MGVNVTGTRESVTPQQGRCNPANNTSRNDPNLSSKYLARKEVFLRLAGEAVAKHGNNFNDNPYYGGVDEFTIKPRPSEEPFDPNDKSKRLPGGPRFLTQQWERTNRRK